MKKAFTFVETLLVIGIIGFIAAITIPGLNNYVQNKQYRMKALKAYSAIGQATDRLMHEHRSTKYFPTDLYTAYTPYLNVAKKCPPSTGCNTKDKIKLASGKGYDCSYGDNGLLLTDGTSIIMSRGVGSVDHYGLSAKDRENAFATIQIDVNGAQPPNQWGTDRWLVLIVHGKGIVASGSGHETVGESGGCKKIYGCLADVVKNK